MRELMWPDRALQWHDAKVSHGLGCGFVSPDMYTEFSRSEQELPPAVELAPPSSCSPSSSNSCSSRTSTSSTLEICCSLECAEGERRYDIAELLLARVRSHFEDHGGDAASLCSSARVVLVTDSRHIPLMATPDGIATFIIPASSFGDDGNTGVEQAAALLDRAGLFVVPDAVCPADAAALYQLATERIQDAEAALRDEGQDIGSGDISYAEIGSRGLQRWDLLLHAEGERQGRGDVAGDPNFAVLERIATSGPWVAAVQTAIWPYKWQASVVCSRPGAPAGRWHTDGGHTAYVFDGRSGPPSCLCIFVPLVPLEPPVESESGEVKHGRGCTAFWPGSHRYRECPLLGAAASARLRAVVPGAPLGVGAALVYDYRTVHCASPNDAFEMEDGDRPILQLTYCCQKYSGVSDNYGYYQLFCD